MAARRYSQFEQNRPKKPDGERPSPGNSGTKAPALTETTAKWPGAPGPKGPSRNTVGFPEVKVYAAQDLADDKGMKKSMKLGMGGRFAKVEAAAKASGAKNPAAVAAAAGRAKYGAKKMAKWAAAGKKRAAKGK